MVDVKRKTKKSKKKRIRIILFIVGLFLCAYPLVASVMDQNYQQSVIKTYQGEMNQTSDAKVQEAKKEAIRYNDIVNITLHFFLKDVRSMLPPAVNHSTSVS